MLSHNVDILLGFALKDSCLDLVILSQYFMIKEKQQRQAEAQPKQTKGDYRHTGPKLPAPQGGLIPPLAEAK